MERVGLLVVMVLAVGMVTARPSRSADAAANILAECRNQQRDIYFLLDSSSSLLRQDFDKFLDFVVSFIEKLDISPATSRIGLGMFANDFHNEFDLNTHSDKTSLIKAIRAAPYYGGDTYTGKGLRGMRTIGFRREVARENATKIGVVVTDGLSRHPATTMAEAIQLKDERVWLFAIGVGSQVDTHELMMFSSDPQREFLRHVNSFEDLAGLTPGLALSACRLQPPFADNATCGRDHKADIIFVYNAAAMSTASLAHVQAFTAEVVRNFSMTSGNVRVGVVSEGRQGGDIALSEYIRKKDFVSALKDQPTPDLSQLLRKVRQEGYEPGFGGRPHSKKFAIVFVDDVTVSTAAILEARMLKFNDVIVYIIGVGLKGDRSKVFQLPSNPAYVEKFDSYAQLQDEGTQLKAKRQGFVQNLCRYM